MTSTPTLHVPLLGRLPRAAWARAAGALFLLYIASGIASMLVDGAAGEVLRLLVYAEAIGLAVALFALTYAVSPALAALAGALRVAESFASAWDPLAGALVFAAGSTVFAWLFLRGALVPRALALLGLGASLLLLAVLPFTGVDWSVPQGWLPWAAMLAYEVVLGAWLLVKGVRR